MGKITSAEKAAERCGVRMTDSEVAELAALKAAAQSRSLTYKEEDRVHVLTRKSISVAHER